MIIVLIVGVTIYSLKKLGDTLTLVHNHMLITHMGNAVSFHFTSRENKSGYGHLHTS